MEATPEFTKIINEHLQEVAQKDPLFAESLKKPKKNIADCVTYILNTVKASVKNGFADAEIFNMAIHYYDEDDINIGKPVSGRVVVNHAVETKGNQAVAPTVQVAPKPKKAVKKVMPEQQMPLF